jgi:hypothetical protein
MFNHGFLFLVEQVSEEVERALAKLGPANLSERYFYLSPQLLNTVTYRI